MRRQHFAAYLVLGLVGGLFLPVVLRAQASRAAKTRCANNLRQLALAVIQYGDDKRFLPHKAATRTLDGGVVTSDTTKAARAMIWFGYHDNPAGFVCPASDDYFAGIANDDVNENMRLWFWGGKATGNNRVTPWIDTLPDPKLNATRELSFGYTRRGYNRNVRSTAKLWADRAVRDGVSKSALAGNHDDGWNVCSADGSVEFTPYAAKTSKWLTDTAKGGGYLAMKAQADESRFKPMGPPAKGRPAWTGYYKADNTRLKIEPRNFSRRSQRWSFTAHFLEGGKKTELYGTVSSEGNLEGLVGSPFADFKASLEGKALKVSRDGRSQTFSQSKAPPPPLDRRLRELAALGLLSALKCGNLEAAEAFVALDSRKKLAAKGVTVKSLMEKISGLPMRELGEHLKRWMPLVVRDKDGVLRIDLAAYKPPAPPSPKEVGETGAIGALKAISNAQSLFREGDKDNDGELQYANTLKKLGDTQLIDSVLASGTKYGYRFKLGVGAEMKGQFMWMVVASPTKPGMRHFAANHTGLIYYSESTPFKINGKCQIEGKVLGR
jgi:alkylhydroperoxidase/carboxymuconolactone decarboxylase family protein YurZ